MTEHEYIDMLIKEVDDTYLLWKKTIIFLILLNIILIFLILFNILDIDYMLISYLLLGVLILYIVRPDSKEEAIIKLKNKKKRID